MHLLLFSQWKSKVKSSVGLWLALREASCNVVSCTWKDAHDQKLEASHQSAARMRPSDQQPRRTWKPKQ